MEKARRLPLEWNSLRGSTLLGEEGEKNVTPLVITFFNCLSRLGSKPGTFLFLSFIFSQFIFEQRSLTEGEGSVQYFFTN